MRCNERSAERTEEPESVQHSERPRRSQHLRLPSKLSNNYSRLAVPVYSSHNALLLPREAQAKVVSILTVPITDLRNVNYSTTQVRWSILEKAVLKRSKAAF